MNKETEQLNATVQQALQLLDSEKADAIIGERNAQYDTLIQGTRASMTLLWMLMQSFGARKNNLSLKGFAQAMTVVLTLVHYAYALGIERGRSQ